LTGLIILGKQKGKVLLAEREKNPATVQTRMKFLLTSPFKMVWLGAAWLNYPTDTVSLCDKTNSWTIHTQRNYL